MKTRAEHAVDFSSWVVDRCLFLASLTENGRYLGFICLQDLDLAEFSVLEDIAEASHETIPVLDKANSNTLSFTVSARLVFPLVFGGLFGCELFWQKTLQD